MSTVARQTAVATLFARLQAMTFGSTINGQSAWVTTSQRLRLWGDVPSDQQPALFLVTHREVDDFTGLGLLRRRLELGAWCYCRTDNPTDVGQAMLDTMMESFEVAMAPDRPDNNLLTLGNQVYWCRIQGRVFKDPGDIDNQAMMIVPIVIEMP